MILSLVANGTNYYVSSSTGDDSNPGTSEDLPWKSLERVNNHFKLYAGDQILFKRGDEWSGTLRVNSSGTEQSRIVYGAYGNGEKPKIFGSEKITGWKFYSGNIYKATFNKTVNQIFLNDIRMKAARYPDTSYFDVTNVINSSSFASTSLKNNINYTGAKWIGRTATYAMVTLDVISSSGTTIQLSNAPSADLNVTEGFFLVGSLDFLDSPGEWYYDSATNTVYIWVPNGDSPENYIIRGAVINYGIEINDKENVTIKDMEFHQNKIAGIYLLKSSNIIIDNNTVIFPDSKGICSVLGTDNIYINNSIIGANHLGIELFESNSLISDNTIKDTFIHKYIGVSGGGAWYMGSGIYVEGDDNLIKYNRVLNSGYNGIHFNSRNIVEYNYINNAVLTKDDGGGIYTSSFNSYPNPKTKGAIIRNNIVDGVWGTLQGFSTYKLRQGFGIYLDENAGGVLIEHNTIANCSGICIAFHKSFNDTARYNTMINARTLFNVNTDLGGSLFAKNIVYALEKNIDNNDVQKLAGIFNGNIKLDSNLYINHYNSSDIFRFDENSNLNFINWKILSKQDQSSTIDNSIFTNGNTEKLIYNDTKLTRKYNVGNSTYTDVYGNKISGTFTLKPFTSIILIGKDFDKINQSPTILDQSFNFISPKTKNDSIGKIVANDPDTAQVLYYSIVQGNEKELFSIDTLTGKIIAKTDIQSSKNISFDLLISVTDSTVNSLSDTAKVTIEIIGNDTSPPVITTFSIPPQYISFTIPISSFTAADDVAVVGFMLTEIPNSPKAEDQNWSIISPNEYTFSKEGTLTLYAWVKDSTGNISESKSDTIIITLPDMSPTFSEYLFEETAGSVILDSKGSNNGIIYNEIMRDEGVIGKALKLNSSGFINLGQSFGENVENEISLSAWIKPGYNNGDNQGIIFHGGTNSYSFALYVNSASKSISFNTKGTTNPIASISNVDKLWDGNWHHLLVTYNGFEKVIYLDNVILSKYSTTGKIASGWGFDLLIGAGTNEISPTLLYEGMIDETRIYNYALSSDEIRELYDNVNRIYKKISIDEFISICEGDDYLGWTKTGQYERVLKRRLASDSYADSIVITHLSINKSYRNFNEATICEGEKIIFGSQILTLSGDYIEVFNTTNGCDSVTELRLTVNPSFNINEEITISTEGNYLGWTKEGIYERLLTTKTGCDSIVVTNLKVAPIIKQHIYLEKGWNIFSTFLIPLNENLNSVMEKLRIEGQLVKVQDENGYTYEELENQMGWVNNIGNLQKTKGYKIRVENDCELEVTGIKIGLPINIIVNMGLNLISFPLEGTSDAMQVMKPLINSGILKKVQDERGNSIENWVNIGWINGIGNFQAGEGYIVQVNENGVLPINDISEKSTLNITDISKPEHFIVNYEGNGYEHMNINVVDLKSSQLKIGDEMAVFDNSLCVGAIKLNELHLNSNRVSIPASSSEADNNNGFKDGNSISFTIWNKQTNQERKLLPEIVDGNLIYKKQGSVFIKIGKEPQLSENLAIYPNPAKGNLNISFLSLPENGALIQIFDIAGKQVFNRELRSNIEVINIENLPAGVYFVKTSINDESNTTKLIII